VRADTSSSLHCEPEHGCITCGDEAVPLRVVEVDANRELALCENEDGARETVEVALVAPVAAGDGVLVHAGTAIANLPREAVAL
jgi:hydrogenase assembly chaperone HypC/HupF